MVNETVDPTPAKAEAESGEGGVDDPRTVTGPDGSTGAVRIRKWFEAVDAVSELTRLNWNQVYELPAIDFLIYIKFYNWKQKKREQQLNQFYNAKGNGRH